MVVDDERSIGDGHLQQFGICFPSPSCGACQPACQAEVRVCAMQRKNFLNISVKRMGAPCFDLNFFDSVPFNHQAIGVACAGPPSPSIETDRQNFS
ncbi:hypothetical protein Taro_008120 [Colocasia esculenta]|uniref:Uncharacterized protein n=1 Tax=Colocasia esculenta TaxID=4460 RepID=A0A843U0Y4_COLES|nr:hypothetical protein [Colocasia esculenta]